MLKKIKTLKVPHDFLEAVKKHDYILGRISNSYFCDITTKLPCAICKNTFGRCQNLGVCLSVTIALPNTIRTIVL